MRRIVIGALVVGLSTGVMADGGKYHGTTVSLDFKSAEFADIVRLLADTGHINVVLVDVPPTPLPIHAVRLPWDQVLDDVVARAKVAYHRRGNLYVIGQPALIAIRKATKSPTFKGNTIGLDVKDLDATAVAMLVESVGDETFKIKPGAAHHATMRLKRVPADEVAEIVLLQTGGTRVGGTRVDKPAPVADTGCVTPKSPMTKLRLAGIADAGTLRTGLLIDDAGVAAVVRRGACVGLAKSVVKEVGDGYVTFVTGTTETSLMVHPTQLPIEAPAP